MIKLCIVCGHPANRVAKSRVCDSTAYVCSSSHARSWQRTIKKVMEEAPGSKDAAPERERRVEDPRQQTFLGGKPVGRGGVS